MWLEVPFRGEISLNQLAEMFQKDKTVVSRHIKTLFEKGELMRGSVAAYFTTGATGDMNFFDELPVNIRDIRSAERVFWHKVLDICHE